MSFKEYNTRDSRRKQPIHIRILDSLREYHDRFRIGWLALALVALYCADRFLLTTSFVRGPSYTMEAEHSIPRVSNGLELRQALAKSTAGYGMAEAALGDAGEPLLVFVDLDSEKHSAMTEAQIRAFDHVVANYAHLKEISLPPMLSAYKKERQALLEYEKTLDGKAKLLTSAMGYPGMDALLPDLNEVEELRRRLDEPSLHIWQQEADGHAYIALSYPPEWSENPFGVVLHGNNVVWAGSYPEDQYHVAGMIRTAVKAKTGTSSELASDVLATT